MQEVVPHSHPNQKPLSTRFWGRKGVLDSRVRRECRIRAALATVTHLPRFRHSANCRRARRLAEPRIRRYRRALAFPGAQAAMRQRATNALKQRSDSAQGSHAERWPSGRRRTPGKCVYVKSVSWVRIPPAPPLTLGPIGMPARPNG